MTQEVGEERLCRCNTNLFLVSFIYDIFVLCICRKYNVSCIMNNVL